MNVRFITRSGVLTALMVLCAWITIPFGEVAVTMQTFSLFLTLCLLGGRGGSLVCLLYLMLGAVGVPVFSGFQGGLAVLLGPTGGYLWGFLAAALVYWLLQRCRIPALLLALTVCYICGTGWYYFMWSEGGVGLILLKCVLPYLLPDALKLFLALKIAPRLEKFA